jgi:predicted nucleic acid-binding protein
LEKIKRYKFTTIYNRITFFIKSVLVDVDRSITNEAAIIKGKFKIAYADCFAAALAHRLNAEVLTGDKEFRKLEEKIKIKWIL